MPTYAWTTSYTKPATLTGLVLTPYPVDGYVAAIVNASVHPYHYAYVWEGQREEGDWIEVDRSTSRSYNWWEAPLNTQARLRVKDWTGTADQTGYSAPVEAITELTGSLWQIVHPEGAPYFTRDLNWVVGESVRNRELEQVTLQPMSGTVGQNAYPIVYTGQWQGDRVTVSLDVQWDDRDVLKMLDLAARQTVPYMILKSPSGRVFRVRPGSRRETELEAGVWRVELEATVVA